MVKRINNMVRVYSINLKLINDFKIEINKKINEIWVKGCFYVLLLNNVFSNLKKRKFLGNTLNLS